MNLCTQCRARPPIWSLGDHFLCVDCYLKLMQAQQIQADQSAPMINFLIDQMDSRVGLPGFSPKIAMPQPIVHAGDMTLNNISIRDSVVGAVNTGEIERLDLAMTNVRAAGNSELANTLKELTQAILDAEDVTEAQRKEMLEAMSYLATQAVLPDSERQKSFGARAIRTLKELLGVSGSLATLAQIAIPVLQRIFS